MRLGLKEINMKTFRFSADTYIEAKNEKEAKDKFADNSFDFASTADCEEVKGDIYEKTNCICSGCGNEHTAS